MAVNSFTMMYQPLLLRRAHHPGMYKACLVVAIPVIYQTADLDTISPCSRALRTITFIKLKKNV